MVSRILLVAVAVFLCVALACQAAPDIREERNDDLTVEEELEHDTLGVASDVQTPPPGNVGTDRAAVLTRFTQRLMDRPYLELHPSPFISGQEMWRLYFWHAALCAVPDTDSMALCARTTEAFENIKVVNAQAANFTYAWWDPVEFLRNPRLTNEEIAEVQDVIREMSEDRAIWKDYTDGLVALNVTSFMSKADILAFRRALDWLTDVEACVYHRRLPVSVRGQQTCAMHQERAQAMRARLCETWIRTDTFTPAQIQEMFDRCITTE